MPSASPFAIRSGKIKVVRVCTKDLIMEFPSINKIHQEAGSVGENAKLLEEKIKSINWNVFVRFYFTCLGIFLVSIFSIIFIVKLALSFFK